jgi:hypothetical protein
MNAPTVTVTVRILVDGANVRLWRVRLLLRIARLLRVPIRMAHP